MAVAGVVGHGLPPVPCPQCRTNLGVTMYRGPHHDPSLPTEVESELGWCELHGEIHSRLVHPNGRTFHSGRDDVLAAFGIPERAAHTCAREGLLGEE